MDKLGIIGIAFFSLLAMWLVFKSVVMPLYGQRIKKDLTIILLIILLIALLHLLGSGFLELIKPFGFEKLLNR